MPQLLGIMLGYVLGPVFIRGDDDSTFTESQFQQLAWATVSLVIIADAFAVWYLYLSDWKAVPEIQSCPTETSKEIVKSIEINKIELNSFESVIISIKTYISDLFKAYKDWRGYGCLTLLSGTGNGLGVIIITATSQILCTYGYSKTVTSFAGIGCLVITGLITTVVIAKISDKYKCSAELMRYCGLVAVLVCWYYCFISTSTGNTAWVLLAYRVVCK